VKDIRVKIRAGRPANRTQFRIHANLFKKRALAKRGEHAFKLNQFLEIDDTLDSVLEANVQQIAIPWSDFDNIG